jgi:hypothetical protein
MTEDTCGKCRYWQPGRAPHGTCRFRSPVVLPTEGRMRGDTAEGVWPLTMDIDWCGRFKRKEEPA